MLPDSVQAFIDHEIASAPGDYSDLRTVMVNGTLKRSPVQSHTEALIDISAHIMRGVGAQVDVVRPIAHTIPPGIYPDLREQGCEVDDFVQIYHDLVPPADILVLATLIWLASWCWPPRSGSATSPR